MMTDISFNLWFSLNFYQICDNLAVGKDGKNDPTKMSLTHKSKLSLLTSNYQNHHHKQSNFPLNSITPQSIRSNVLLITEK